MIEGVVLNRADRVINLFGARAYLAVIDMIIDKLQLDKLIFR